MRITLLGTGTPNPSLKRMSSSYAVEVGEDVLVFDHGPGAFHRLMEAGISAIQVSHLFLSHLHYDHCLDYARLVLTRWDQGAGKIPELRVFGPSHTKKMTDLLFAENGVFDPDLIARTQHEPSVQTYISRGGTPPRHRPEPEVQIIQDGSLIEERKWSIKVIGVPHAQPYLESFGFRLDSPEGAFAYSGDAGPSDDFAHLIKGCDVLVHMCHTLSGTEPGPEWARGAAGHLEAARVARDGQVRNLVLSHIPEQMDVPGIREKVIAEVAGVFEGNIFWGEDLLEIPVSDPTPEKHTG
jgi:ribonuclease BN (tRNA processing enzyme)